MPSDYFESTVLEESVDKACTDYRNEELCIQYKYLSIDHYNPIVISNNIFDDQVVEIDLIKEFNHSYAKPLMATKLNDDNVSILKISFVIIK